MKKVFILSILVLFVGSLLALESGPSEVVGFFKVSCTDGSYTPYSLPLTFYDATHTVTTALNDIVGGQLTGGTNPSNSDVILDKNSGQSAWYRSSTSVWVGALATTGFTKTHAYYVSILSGNGDQDVYLAGTVEKEILDFGSMQVGFYNPIGFKEAGDKAVTDLGLIAAGFTGGTNPSNSDILLNANTGQTAWYRSATSAWVGALATSGITAGHAYYVYVHPTHTAFNWIYNPGTDGSDAISKISTPPVPPVSKKAVNPVVKKEIETNKKVKYKKGD
ncbi:MAG: hypothetical protein KAW88_06150 [Candidatus Cloacimonetes bacterium]|nr:hypothetical protein [Candidatus Cloacimonadota bacterium]